MFSSHDCLLLLESSSRCLWTAGSPVQACAKTKTPVFVTRSTGTSVYCAADSFSSSLSVFAVLSLLVHLSPALWMHLHPRIDKSA